MPSQRMPYTVLEDQLIHSRIRRLTAAAEAGRLPIARAPTLGRWLERYLDEVAASSVRPSTLRRYRPGVMLILINAL
jgi:hypothetical protein